MMTYVHDEHRDNMCTEETNIAQLVAAAQVLGVLLPSDRTERKKLAHQLADAMNDAAAEVFIQFYGDTI